MVKIELLIYLHVLINIISIHRVMAGLRVT